MSSPFKTSLSSYSPTVSKLHNHATSLGSSPSLVNKALDFPQQTTESITPILEAPCPYPSRKLNPSPLTLATKTFLNKLSMDIDGSPLMDSFSKSPLNPTGQESNNTSEIEVLATSPFNPSKFPSSETLAQSNSPEFLTAFHSSDLLGASLCTSSLAPSETLEKSCCTSPTDVDQGEIPPRNPPRRLFRRLCTNNNETHLKTGSGLVTGKIVKASPVILQSKDVSFKTSKCTQGPCSTSNAGKSALHVRFSSFCLDYL